MVTALLARRLVGVPETLATLVYIIGVTAALAGQALAPGLSRLQNTAKRIHSRMRGLGLNETELSERCSLAAIKLFEDAEVPSLTRDRVSKILMNRQDVPAKSAARVVTNAELTVLAQVLQVPTEWLLGQEQNRDPVVWNVLTNPDRAVEFANLIQAYEEVAKENRVWSQSPMYAFGSEAFVHAFNHVRYGSQPGAPNTKPLVDFHNRMARLRRKWLLRPDRSFKYTNLINKSDFEDVICGKGIFSAISKTILTRNLDVMIDVISNPSLKMELVVLNDENALAREALRNYEFVAAVDNLCSVWGYHNTDVGWSEHPSYANSHRQLLDRMVEHRICRGVGETVDYLKSLQSCLRPSPKRISGRSTSQQIT
jgi:hypothetical protein